MTQPLKFGLPENVIHSICSVLKSHSNITKAVIYGSRAKGNYRESSDIDITLFCEDNSLSSLFKIENDIDDLLLPYKIDLSLYTQIDNEKLKDHIDRVGIVLYQQAAANHSSK